MVNIYLMEYQAKYKLPNDEGLAQNRRRYAILDDSKINY